MKKVVKIVNNETEKSKNQDQKEDFKKEEVKRLSYKERRENAQAPRAEEGRDKLRKAVGRSKYLEIHRYPNEGTHLGERAQVSACE